MAYHLSGYSGGWLNIKEDQGGDFKMNVNGVTTGVDAYAAYTQSTKETDKKKTESDAQVASDVAAVYEKTEETADSSVKKYKPDMEMVAKLKADAEERTAQLKSLVEKIIMQQADKSQSIFDFLGKEYSAEDIAKAKEDVSEDGYYGVKQTSQRILDFAVALTGGDPSKIEAMKDAFKKGYEMAEKAWGGELPDICKDTYDAVFKGFDEMAEKAKVEA